MCGTRSRAVKGRPRWRPGTAKHLDGEATDAGLFFGGRERRLHVQSIDLVAGVNGVALNAGDSG
jgi:hypothetical protein